MLIVKLWHYIRGYVIINIKGRHLERVINLIHHNNILIWDIVKVDSGKIKARIELKDYKQVIEISNRLSCEVEIIRKSGMTLWKWRLQTRKFFAVAFILVLLAVYIISSMVITIEVQTETSIDEANILKELEELGLKSWVLKNNLNMNEIEAEFLKNHKEIDFMNIEINGTKITIDIVASEESQKIYDKSIPVDLIASKDGIIKDMLIINGTSNVEIDQKVKKGDLLVKGEVVTQKVEESPEITYIHAMAKIMAQTSYDKDYEIRKYKVIDEEDYKFNRVLHIGGLVINFHNGEKNYYYESNEEQRLKILGNELPIKIDKIKYYAKENCIDKSKEELEDEVKDKAKEEFNKIGQVQNIEINSSTVNNNVYKYKISITIIEEISEEQKIDKEE
ncbi:sporulation protein YqfD [Alkalibaculum sporogenes]|uniref:sporulation protein YqfD n=1 Tax=Alkalibaculum sporogenes TaxID=2655001 RepID=UPI00128B9C42|nr:sporulation protein YqfD [Alkalibaculum sporogenes]